MFTGLIQETGEVTALKQRGGKTSITIQARKVPSELELGDSVAVSGVCLTAVEVSRKQFSADLAEETLQRTSLGNLKKRSAVNLELPARPAERLGGHIVQGHVDGVGKLLALHRIRDREDWRLVIEIPETLAKYIVPQGSICVEGISLTVAAIQKNQIEIAIIPHTYAETNLHSLKPGSPVNIEVDVLAKYVERLVHRAESPSLSVDDLVKCGF